MGYYVKLTQSTVQITPEQQNQVYKIWCDLNKPENNHLKRGGSFNGKDGKTNHWYSWMSENYDKECKTCEEILDRLCFSVEKKENGNLILTDYDGKTGQEELFFQHAAPFISPGIMNWIGEDDYKYYWAFDSRTMEIFQTRSAAKEFVDKVQLIKEEKRKIETEIIKPKSKIISGKQTKKI